ncbi:intracellular protein transport protein USO1 [Drosophila subpulchrella]|uniref:intracellular protein transport protein USO1 n=1 Tax=Drosophila subpulchrella TaxID=1486046 RepID=UPI0018A1B321|nr:intracellular protein transport protein USO1 [Drosophila subpulchrella]XP_037732401.1 intracellular protein transport protein USO1 [Drosophila subpulchrella]XP_037732402.1 intracellular protein transport protein USO1 [Drosophila subpulchrella]
MAGAKKRAGSQIVSAVRPKSPRKSTVTEPPGTQIPKENSGDAKGPQTQEKPAPLENVFKKRELQKVSCCETPKNKAPKRPSLDENPLEKPTVSIPVKSPKKKIQKLSKTPEILWKEIKNLSPGTGALLDCFMKHHNESFSNLKKRNLMTSRKMRNIAVDTLKKNTENISLKKKLANTQLELTHSKKDLADQEEKNTENINKFKKINQKYTESEKNYNKELGIVKACVEKKNSELKAAQSRNEKLERELKNMQETNRELAGAMSNYKLEMEKAQMNNSEVQTHLNELTQAYEALEHQFDDLSAQKDVCEANIVQLGTELNAKMVTCAELEDRVKQLPIEANKALSILQNELEANKLRYQEQQRLTDQADKELELSRNEINTLKTLMEEKERAHITLTGEHQKMTARLVELVDINEHYSKELAETNLKHSQDMKNQANKHETAIRELESLLDKASLDFTKLKNSIEALQKEKLLQASQLQGEINELKLRRNNQQEALTKLANELEVKTHSFEGELKVQHEQLSNQMQVMRAEFETESQRAAVEIERLTVALQQKEETSKAQQEKLQRLLTDYDKLKDTLAHLEAKNERMANEFSASKFQLSQELKYQKDNLMKKISELELEIKNKEAKMLELECDKNNEMAVLQFKMNRINSVIDQPVMTIPKLPEPKGLSKTQSTPNKVQPQESDNFSSSSSKKHTVRRHRITTVHASDFESDDDLPVVQEPNSVKRAKLSAVVKPQKEPDLFDMLKRSN